MQQTRQKKRILIDVNPTVSFFVNGRMSGIGRTTMELVQELSLIDNLPFDIELYSQNFKGIGALNINVPFRKHHLYLRNQKTWNKTIAKFPIREWLTGYDLMHITHNFEYVRHPERCIVTLHDALFMRFQEKAFEHELMKKIVPPFIRKCKYVITCSHASKRDIIETMNISENKISVIYWGINHNIFKQINNKSYVQHIIANKYGIHFPYFLSVSCNIERKRTDILINSYIAYCQNHIPKNDLVLVWRDAPAKIMKQIHTSSCRQRIHILNGLSDSELALFYNGAKTLIFPSSYEGFGLPIIEAMACGTPVITCNNSSLSEIGGKAAIYIDEPIEESLYSCLETIENDAIELVHFSKLGLKRAQLFRWEKAAQKTIEVYSKCLIK